MTDATTAKPPTPTRVGVAGTGAIGSALIRRLAEGLPGYILTAVAARDHAKGERLLAGVGTDVPVVDVADLEPYVDLVIECTPAALLYELAGPVLRAGKEVVVLSAGAILRWPDLVDLASAHGGKLTVPTGALLGLDAVCAAAEDTIHSVRIVSRKPLAGLAGAPMVQQLGIDLDSVTEPVLLFAGTAREAVQGFPANVNVAVALALAGIGPERTEVEVWADPEVTRNTHTVTVDAEVARLEMKIENVPSENPRTGRITALSVISLLRKRSASLRVGS